MMHEDDRFHLQELFERLQSQLNAQLDEVVYLEEPFALTDREVQSGVPVFPDGFHTPTGSGVPLVPTSNEGGVSEATFIAMFDQIQAATLHDDADTIAIFAKLAVEARARLSEAQWHQMVDLLDLPFV